jgi:hypothetical protein
LCRSHSNLARGRSAGGSSTHPRKSGYQLTKSVSYLSEMLGSTFGRQDTRDDDAFRISLAGAQEKTAFLRNGDAWMVPHGTTPTTHIFKLPMGIRMDGIDLSTSVENEWLCSEIIREFGIDVARCRMESYGSYRVLVVERFDRRLSSSGTWWLRLPQEDFCQATGTPPGLKYESDGGPGMRRIMDVLLGSTNAEKDRLTFFRTQMLFWVLGAIDGHAKNFSVFLEAGGSYRLAPLYDILSAYPYDGRRAWAFADAEDQDGNGRLWREPALRMESHRTTALGGDGSQMRHRRRNDQASDERNRRERRRCLGARRAANSKFVSGEIAGSDFYRSEIGSSAFNFPQQVAPKSTGPICSIVPICLKLQFESAETLFPY